MMSFIMKSVCCYKPFGRDWLNLFWLVVGICLQLHGCTKPPVQSSPPTPASEIDVSRYHSYQSDVSAMVENQLLETVKTAENLGEGNPLLMSSLYNLATFYEQQGEFEKAEEQYKRALSIKEKTRGPNHPDVALILNKYAGLLRQTHRDEEAEHLAKRASKIMAQ